MVEKSFTLIFAGDIRKFQGNPFKTDTPFGTPYACGVGDAFTRIDELEEANEVLRRKLGAKAHRRR